jgi:hypothetical protein
MSKVTIDQLHTDNSTNKLVTVEYEHHELHDGNMFSCHYIQSVTDTNDRSVIAFTTPADKEVHMIIHASASAAASLIVLEGAVGTSAGATDLTVYNRDRNSTNTSLLTSIDGTTGAVSYYTLTTDTAITGGTELYSEYIGAGKTGQAAAGSSRGTNEWILKKSTVYDFELKSLDANDNSHNLELVWYEHTNKHGGT